MYAVTQDDVIVGAFDTVEECQAYIADARETQKIALLSKRKILKAFFKKNIPLNLSNFRIFVEVEPLK